MCPGVLSLNRYMDKLIESRIGSDFLTLYMTEKLVGDTRKIFVEVLASRSVGA